MECIVVCFVLILRSTISIFLSLSKMTLPLFKCVLSSVCPRSRPPSSVSLTLFIWLFSPCTQPLPAVVFSLSLTLLLHRPTLTICHRLTGPCRLLHGLHDQEGWYMAPTWWNVSIFVSKHRLSNCLDDRLNSRILPTSNMRVTGCQLHSRFDHRREKKNKKNFLLFSIPLSYLCYSCIYILWGIIKSSTFLHKLFCPCQC